MIDLLNDSDCIVCLSVRLSVGFLIEWIDLLIDWLTDGLIHQLTTFLTDLLTDLLTDCLTQWLMDEYIQLLSKGSDKLDWMIDFQLRRMQEMIAKMQQQMKSQS